MIRGLLAGVFWGAVVSALGLAGVSLTMPLPPRGGAGGAPQAAVAPPPASPAPSPAVAPVDADLPEGPTVPAPPVASESGAEPASAEVPAMPVLPVVPATPDVPQAGAAVADRVAPIPDAGGVPAQTLPPAGVESAAVEAPAAEAGAIAPVAVAPAPAAQDGWSPVAGASDSGGGTVPQAVSAVPVVPPQAPVSPAAVPEAPVTAAALPAPAAVPPAATGAPEGGASEPAPAAPAPEAEPAPQTAALRPTPGLDRQVDGVRTGRLPSIAPEAAPVEDAAADPAEAEAAPAGFAGALARNARAFANPEGKPPFAVLLLDTGDATVDLAALAVGPVPVTLVIDPSRPEAVARAEAWRAAGQEVAVLTSALPARGQATDFEVALEALETLVPQALAVVEPPEGWLQSNRAAVVAATPALLARGYGLVSWDRGLNVAAQLAERASLPAAGIFRELDAEGETAPVVRRYLDRAAFKAQQDGKALVFGRLRPDTVAALTEWATGTRAAALALAPLSATLSAGAAP